MRDDTTFRGGHAAQLRSERATLELLDELGYAQAPRLLASDPDRGLLVLEDLAPRVPLADVLRGAAPGDPVEGLCAFARALGTLHAMTRGAEDRHRAWRRSAGVPEAGPDRGRPASVHWSRACERMPSLGVTSPPEAERELAGALHLLAEPGLQGALTHGDADVNNVLVQGGDARLIDFEDAGYGLASFDVARLYVPGPHWITVGDPSSNGVEAAYREALREGTSAVDDDVFDDALAAACFVHVLARLDRLPRLDVRPAGDDSRKPLVSTLEAAAGLADARRCMPALSAWLNRCAGALRRRWPDADEHFGRYPSYTPRARGA